MLNCLVQTLISYVLEKSKRKVHCEKYIFENIYYSQTSKESKL